jgi:DNA-directed RNA polymerase specialized sigma24 family protein
MNQPISSTSSIPHLRLVTSNPQLKETRRSVPAGDSEPFVRCYRHLERRLRAGCANYVDPEDVRDLVQDVWIVAAQHPARLAQSDGRTLSWLIGIAKQCARSYESMSERMVPLDELMAREAGDDLEGRALFEDVDEIRAAKWGDSW